MSLDKMFQTIEHLRDTASANAVFGEPREAEGRLIIPVAQVRLGLGLGLGQGMPEEASEEPDKEPEGAAEGGGGGGGAGARPVAILEVTPEETLIKPIVDESKVALAGILLVGWSVFWLMLTLRAIFGRRG